MTLHIRGITFVHLKKCAGSSVKKWFYDHMPAEHIQGYGKHAPLKKVKNPGFSFTIVRNPFAREVSWYFYIKEKMPNKLNRQLYKGSTNSDRVEEYEKLINQVETQSFKDYVMNTRKTAPPMWANAEGVDCVMRQETLNEDFKIIQEMLDIHKPLPFINSSGNKAYQDFYDNELKDFVYKKFKKDFELYGYEF